MFDNRQLSIAALIMHHQRFFITTVSLSIHHLHSSRYTNQIRQTSDSMTRIPNYYEIPVPQYSVDDFKMHFRLSRATLQSTCARLSLTLMHILKLLAHDLIYKKRYSCSFGIQVIQQVFAQWPTDLEYQREAFMLVTNEFHQLCLRFCQKL